MRLQVNSRIPICPLATVLKAYIQANRMPKTKAELVQATIEDMAGILGPKVGYVEDEGEALRIIKQALEGATSSDNFIKQFGLEVEKPVKPRLSVEDQTTADEVLRRLEQVD